MGPLRKISPPFLTAGFLAHIFPNKEPSDLPEGPDQGDPEKAGASGSGTGQDEAFDADRNDADQEVEDVDDDLEETLGGESADGASNEGRSGRGVPLTSTGTISSMNTFSRPSLPNWLVRIKDVLFVSHQDHEEFIPNYRRAVIVSGSLVPFSILLEIPGLTEHWYIRTYGYQIVESQKNPPWIIIALSFSLALAVIANVALVNRFLERRVKRCTIISIIALTIHDILNIATVVIWAIQHRFDDGFTNGEAFWMTICSTIVSSITNVILIWDLVTTPNFEKAGSGITRKQRSLVIITIIFLSYIAIGALTHSLMMSLSFIDGLFFTVVTTLAIGFGDIVPITAAQRVVVCLYGVIGIVILGAAVRLTSVAVLEGIQVGYRRRLRDFKRRRRERKRERELVRRWRAAVEERLVERGLEVWTPDRPAQTLLPSSNVRRSSNVRPSTLRRGSNFVSQAMYLNTEALPPNVLEEAAREAGVPPEKFIGRKFGRRARDNPPQHHHQPQRQGKESERPARVPLDFTWTIDDGAMHGQKSGIWGGAWWDRARRAMSSSTNAGDETPNSQDSDGNMTQQKMVKVLERDERRSLYIKLGLAWAMFFAFWIVGSLIFSATENWGYGSAMYFCVIAFTTIGYGDLAPKSPLGRGIFVFWALFGVGAVTVLFSVVTDAFSSKYQKVTHDKGFDRAVRRYRQGQEKAMWSKAGESSSLLDGRRPSLVVPALQASLARVSSREPAQPYISPPQPPQTLGEAEARLRARIEPLPAMIMKEVFKLRDHTRYFLLANGHADAMGPHVSGATVAPTPKEYGVPDDLKQLLDEIAHEEGFEERLKQEVWDDAHARNTLVLLSLEKGARKMVEAAELALVTLTERDEMILRERREIQVEEPEENREGEE